MRMGFPVHCHCGYMNKSIICVVMVIAAVIAFIFSGKWKNTDPRGTGDGNAAGLVTRATDREASGPEREERRKRSIDLAAQKWYEELLEKYPEMRPVYRDVPDERNGYLQFLLLAESVRAPLMPDDLDDMIFGSSKEWDAGRFEAWMSENRTFFDELLRVAELPERSAKGVAMDRIFGAPARYGAVFGNILRASARVAFEKGDQETALRHMKASMAIGDHVVDTEVPTMLSEVISVGIRTSARDLFREEFLPVLAADPEGLSRWKEVVFRDEEPAAEYARVMIGEWNASARSHLLPALLGDHSKVGKALPVDDVESLIETYTRSLQGAADGVLQSGADRFDIPAAAAAYPQAGSFVKNVGKEEVISADALLSSMKMITEALGKTATRTAMVSAAVSILRGEVPPVDPVSGEVFLWDAETRTLRTPGGGEEDEPIIVPRGIE